MHTNNVYSVDGANAANWQFDSQFLAPQYVGVEKLTQCKGRIKQQGLYSVRFGTSVEKFDEVFDVYG